MSFKEGKDSALEKSQLQRHRNKWMTLTTVKLLGLIHTQMAATATATSATACLLLNSRATARQAILCVFSNEDKT